MTKPAFRRLVLAVVWSVCLWALPQATSPMRSAAQSTEDLLEFYRHQRALHRFRAFVARTDGRMPVREPDHVAGPADTVHAWIMSKVPAPPVEPEAPEPSFPLESIRRIRKLEFQAFASRFAETEWAFLGADGRAAIDTMLTSRIRAAMEHHFGAPTRTLVEIGSPDTLSREEIIEFEYWFFLNGDIPFLVMDVNGPWDRGVVVAAEQSWREDLHLIRRAVLSRITDSPAFDSFADYYYNHDQAQWYVTGFNGARFFDVRIDRPNMRLGRPVPESAFPDASRSD